MTQTQPTVQTLKAVSRRLVWALVALLVALIALYAGLFFINQVPVMPVVMIFGALGAFVSLQRRLKRLSEQDLLLMKDSLPYTWLAPVTGALLAGLLYVLFLSNLLSEKPFPSSSIWEARDGWTREAFPYGERRPSHVCKALFWSFVADTRRNSLPISSADSSTSGINGPRAIKGRGILTLHAFDNVGLVGAI